MKGGGGRAQRRNTEDRRKNRCKSFQFLNSEELTAGV